MNKVLRFAPFYIISLIPLRVLYVFSDFLYLITYYIVRYRRLVTWQNLRKSFPEKDDKQLRRIERGFYKHFCDLFFETIKLLTISPHQIESRAKVMNPEILDRSEKEGRPVIWYMSHMGNWEWFTSFADRMSYSLITFYKPQSNKYFNDLLLLIRSRFGSEMVPSNSGFRYLLSASQKSALTGCCIIGDQKPNYSKSTTYSTDFLNQSTEFLTGAEEIGRKLKADILFPKVSKPRRGFYEVTYIPISQEESKGAVTESYAKMLEAAIREYPHIWLWSHRRWKKRKRKKN